MSLASDVKALRTKQINDFMSQFMDLNEIDTETIEEGLRNILGEVPGIDFEYHAETSLNEKTGKDDRIKKLSKIHIYYTFIDDTNHIIASKVSYLVD